MNKMIGKIYMFNPRIKVGSLLPGYIDPRTKDLSMYGMIVKVMRIENTWVTGKFIKHNNYTRRYYPTLKEAWSFHPDQLITIVNNRLAINPINTPGDVCEAGYTK